MDRLRILGGGGSQDNHLLETDIMRFVAILGMVLWVIFAILKSIPFQASESDSPVPGAKKEEHYSSRPATPMVERKESTLPSAVKKEDSNAGKNSGNGSGGPRGLHMEFASLDDLLALMAMDKVRLFCRAQAGGFDLFFESRMGGNTIAFRSAEDLPASLWEMKSGKDHAYFLGLIGDTIPAIKSFPIKQVLIAFADKELQEKVEKTLTLLGKDGKSGLLSIGHNGEITFTSENNKKKVIEQINGAAVHQEQGIERRSPNEP